MSISNGMERKKRFYNSLLIENENGEKMLGKLMLVVAEVAEAAEAVRHNDLINFREEIADTFIRLSDICGTMDIDIEKDIENKMIINEGRALRHGTKILL